MKEVQPIRDTDQIEMMKDYLKNWNRRNFLLFIIGLNSGLRISDIVPLKVKDFEHEHLELKEKKTRKAKTFYINDAIRKEVNAYVKEKDLKPYDYLFESRKRSTKKGYEGQRQPISTNQAWKILKQAAKEFGIQKVGTHTMRKSFGYHLYKKTGSVALLMEIFNHSSPDITLKYIGINQEEQDKEVANFKL